MRIVQDSNLKLSRFRGALPLGDDMSCWLLFRCHVRYTESETTGAASVPLVTWPTSDLCMRKMI